MSESAFEEVIHYGALVCGSAYVQRKSDPVLPCFSN